ncbi:MAG TPA: adenylyltransferase/cytidyltransferase family protein [Chloroflexota bacterium]|jgi:rfaE bifunctional protein nucleotidyltransferase chain/domain|nr:adenylyltransferase/cytidyltransferase family protein [Chloroflexota bacterium]
MGRVVTRSELSAALAAARAAGQRIVLTNGCFDLLHVGHVRALRAARALGDVLVVGLNSDRSVRGLKGEGRPLIAQEERAELLAALEPVDFVVVFEEPTAERLAELVRPAVYAKGGDYATEGAAFDARRLPEAKVVAAHGGETVLVPLAPGRSTTDLVARIRAGAEPA